MKISQKKGICDFLEKNYSLQVNIFLILWSSFQAIFKAFIINFKSLPLFNIEPLPTTSKRNKKKIVLDPWLIHYRRTDATEL